MLASLPRDWLLPIGLVAVLGGSACWTTVRPERPRPEPAASIAPQPEPGAVATVVTPDRHHSDLPEPDPTDVALELPLPRVELSEMSGPGAASLNTAYVPVMRTHLEACGAKKGDVIQVVLITQDGDIVTRLKNSNAGTGVGACVVNRMAVDMDNVLSPSKSPSERLENVQSVLTISW